jgi:hypothetical protein
MFRINAMGESARLDPASGMLSVALKKGAPVYLAEKLP